MSQHYPGLNLHRFLMEVEDILRKNLHNNILRLSDASFSLSDKVKKELSESFLKGIPFAYLLGKSEFYGNEYFVNNDVLIPRPETEYLVDLIVNEFKGKTTRILDVGTGSGVILLALLQNNVGKTGVGVDICEKALKVAAINASRLRLQDKVTLAISDRLNNVEGTFDLIVSNPPYIKASSHKSLVHDSVDSFEPHQALYLPDDFYVFWFEDFFQSIRSQLKGTFFMEGHELEVEDQAKLLGRLGFKNISVLNDLSGTKRFLRACI